MIFVEETILDAITRDNPSLIDVEGCCLKEYLDHDYEDPLVDRLCADFVELSSRAVAPGSDLFRVPRLQQCRWFYM